MVCFVLGTGMEGSRLVVLTKWFTVGWALVVSTRKRMHLMNQILQYRSIGIAFEDHFTQDFVYLWQRS